MNKRILLISLLCCLIFANFRLPHGFAQGREWERARVGTLAADESSAAGEMDPIVQYFISPGDKMEVFVWQNPDVSKEVIVGPDGKISYPLAGRIQASGLTIEQLEEEITEGLSEFIKYPYVSIMMKKYAGKKIVVLGEIRYPGIYTYTGAINVIEAVALAGDFTDRAREDSVILVRGNLTENPEVMRLNVMQDIRKGTSNWNIVLQANDVVYVPKSFIGNINKFLQNFWPALDTVSKVLSNRLKIRALSGHGN